MVCHIHTCFSIMLARYRHFIIPCIRYPQLYLLLRIQRNILGTPPLCLSVIMLFSEMSAQISFLFGIMIRYHGCLMDVKM